MASATQMWRENEETIEDITCVVVFFGKRLIMRNYSNKDLEEVEQRKFKRNSYMETILARDDIIEEEEEDLMTTIQ